MHILLSYNFLYKHVGLFFGPQEVGYADGIVTTAAAPGVRGKTSAQGLRVPPYAFALHLRVTGTRTQALADTPSTGR